MSWELAAQIMGTLIGAATLYRLVVSPVVKDRNAAWERIRELEAEVKGLRRERDDLPSKNRQLDQDQPPR